MADNLAVTAGSGNTIAADEVSGVLYQRVKPVVSADGVAPVDVSSTDPIPATVLAQTEGGVSTARYNDVDETEETVKGSAGQLYGFHAINEDGSNDHYLHFYDAASPDTSADTPKMTYLIPAGGSITKDFPLGVPFSTAITVAALTTAAPGATGPGANEVYATIEYK